MYTLHVIAMCDIFIQKEWKPVNLKLIYNLS